MLYHRRRHMAAGLDLVYWLVSVLSNFNQVSYKYCKGVSLKSGNMEGRKVPEAYAGGCRSVCRCIYVCVCVGVCRCV